MTTNTVERAERAVKTFRRMQGTLSSFARVLTGQPVRVEAGAMTATDGKVIKIVPPIALGDELSHERRLCERMDEDGVSQCQACREHDMLMASLYHEVSHIAFGTFSDFNEPLDRVIRMAPLSDEARTKMLERYERLARTTHGTVPTMRALSHLSEFLPALLNCVEDARIDTAMGRARAGTTVMRHALVVKYLTDGIEGMDGKVRRWTDRPLNSQAGIAMFLKGIGVRVNGALAPEAYALSDLPEISALIENNIQETATVKTSLAMTLAILEEAQKYGFFRSDDPEQNYGSMDSDDEEESDADGDSGEGEESSEKAESGDSDDGDAEDDAGEGDGSGEEPSSGESGGEDSDSESKGGTGESESDNSGAPDESGDSGGDSDGANSDDEGENEAGTGGTSSPGEEGDGDETSGGDDAGRGEPGADPEQGDDDVPADESREGDDAEGMEGGGDAGEYESGTSEPEDGDGDSGDTGSADDPGSDSPGGTVGDGLPGDGEPDGAEGSSELPEGSSIDSGERPSEPGEGEPAEEQGDAPEFGDDFGDGDSASTEGLTGDGEQKSPADLLRELVEEETDFGDARSAREDVEELIGHDAEFHADHDETHAERKAVSMEVTTSVHFDTRSRVIETVKEHKRWVRRIPLDVRAMVPESILGPSLLQARRVFTDNARGAVARNRRSGRVDSRTLGRRAWGDDDRLFKRKSLPGKKDWAVLIGLDISGSTGWNNSGIFRMMMASGFAQAELCQRLGLKFAVYAHTGWENSLDIYKVKEFNEPWNETTINRLQNLQPKAANLDGHTLEYYRKRLSEVQATDKILMYYTDGAMPAENYDEELELLYREIETCRKLGYVLMGVGIKSSDPIKYGMDTVRVNSPEDVRNVVTHLGKKIVEITGS